MIRISQIKIPVFETGGNRETEERLVRKRAAAVLRLRPDDLRKCELLRRSPDLRNKDELLYVYTVLVRLKDSVAGPGAENELAFVRSLRNRNVTQEVFVPVSIPKLDPGKSGALRPVVVGAGPCGLFAALTLIEAGAKPLILERGACIEEREADCEAFFRTGKLDPDSNVQFGEGGAGTFSDGKLNTSVKGQESMIRHVLKTFVRFGADPDILVDQRPHIGTDELKKVVKAMRLHILENGGEIRFRTLFCGLLTENGRLSGIRVKSAGSGSGEEEIIPCGSLILAAGHSARDTYAMLKDSGIAMEKKNFAMGIRVMHPQELIDASSYGKKDLEKKRGLLGPSTYRLSYRAANGRSVYSFCMCPGGYVINSSSEEGRLCVNGMSYHRRDSGTANSALAVGITAGDFPGDDVLSGLAFQRELERKAFLLADGCIPAESVPDFIRGEAGPKLPEKSCLKTLGAAKAADVRSILPGFMQEALCEALGAFGRSIPGFDGPEGLVAGIEARTSSPVRILRDERGESSLPGLYPAGEGAGYAGGITTSAADGVRAAVRLVEAANSEEKDHS